MKLLCSLIFCVFTLLIQAQPIPAIEWEKNYGGSGEDFCFALDRTNDGAYILAGKSRSDDYDVTGNISLYDFWVVKINTVGAVLWQKSLGGIHDEEARSIRSTSDGGYILVGNSDSNDGDVSGHHGTTSYSDIWVVKLNSIGHITWQKSLGGTSNDEGRDVRQTSDGGYIVAGYTNSTDGDVVNSIYTSSNYWVIKLDSQGNLIWQKTYGGSDHDQANSIQETSDMGYIVAGSTASIDGDISNPSNFGTSNHWVLKLDSIGNIEWDQTISSSASDAATSITENNSGGVSIVGCVNSDYRIIEVDNSGNLTKDYSFGGNAFDYPRSIRNTSDGGYILAGQSNSWSGNVTGNQGGTDYWITKVNSDTIVTWETCLGTGELDYGAAAVEAHDGGYIVAGYVHNSGGNVSNHYGNNDFWVAHLSVQNLGVNEQYNPEVTLFPNPAMTTLNVEVASKLIGKELSVYNLDGRVVKNGLITSNVENLNISSLKDGVYFLAIKGTGISKSFVKQ